MLYYIQYKGDRYLRQDKDGSFNYVAKTVVATQFTREIATKIINNQIKFCDRKYHKLVEVGTEALEENKTTSPELTVSNGLVTKIDLMVDGLASLSSLCKSLPDLKQQLYDEQSKIDSQISDVEHYIEFQTLNAPKGYAAYKLLHDLLGERRKIKDAMIKISVLESNTKSINEEHIRESINGLENRQYTPRVLVDLFKD